MSDVTRQINDFRGAFAASADVGFEFFVANFSQVFIWAPGARSAAKLFPEIYNSRPRAHESWRESLRRLSHSRIPPRLMHARMQKVRGCTYDTGVYRTCVLLYLHARYSHIRRYVCTCLDCATTSCEPILSLEGEGGGRDLIIHRAPRDLATIILHYCN